MTYFRAALHKAKHFRAQIDSERDESRNEYFRS